MELQDAALAFGEPLLRALTSANKQQGLSSLARETHCLQNWHLTLVHWQKGQVWWCTCLEHLCLLVQLIMDLQCHLLVHTLCDVGQVLFGDEYVKFWVFSLQRARAHELEGVCCAGVWQNSLDESYRDTRRPTTSPGSGASMI